jgi:glycosyltransferase involved in cell wall biosynthesis
MKIILLGNLSASAINFRGDLIQKLAKLNWQVYVFCTDFNETSEIKIEKLGGIPVKYKFSRSGFNPFKDIANTFALFLQIKKIAPDLIFSYFAKPVIFGTIAAYFARVPVKFGMLEGLGYSFVGNQNRSYGVPILIRMVQVFLYKAVLKKLDRLILLNDDDRLDLIEKYKIKIHELTILGGIGVDLKKITFSPPRKDELVTFLFIGRLLMEKGLLEFVEASKIVRKSFSDVRFIVVGDFDMENPGGLKPRLLEETFKNNLIEHVGYVDDVINWIRLSSVFVLPSYREGVPRSTQEAMAVGRAVITTDVAGCRDTVVDGVNGFLVPPRSAEALAEKMIHFLKHKEDIELMGLRARHFAETKYDADKINNGLIEILKMHLKVKI